MKKTKFDEFVSNNNGKNVTASIKGANGIKGVLIQEDNNVFIKNGKDISINHEITRKIELTDLKKKERKGEKKTQRY